MNTFIRIIVALCGIALLLPGLCTLYFGGMFALDGLSARDMYGLGALSIPWLIVGGLLVWGGWLVLGAAWKSTGYLAAVADANKKKDDEKEG